MADRYSQLPLSSLFLPLQSHPLLRPIHPRLSHIESSILLSPPSSILLSLGLSPALISTLALASFVAALARTRHQWRFWIASAGVVEALVRSWSLLHQLEQDSTTPREKDKGKDRERDEEREQETRDETRHLVAFWTVYALVQLVQSYLPRRALPLSPSLPRLPLPIRRLIRRLPLLPSPPLLPRRRAAFPQPTPLPSLSPSSSPSKHLTPPLRALLKLLFLWTALRKDGTGASLLFDWIIGPILAVRQARRGGRKRRVVVIEDAERPEVGRRDSSEDEPGEDPFGSPHGDDNAEDDGEERTTPEGVTYRLTSTAHPIHGRTVRAYEREQSPSPRRVSVGRAAAPTAVGGTVAHGMGYSVVEEGAEEVAEVAEWSGRRWG